MKRKKISPLHVFVVFFLLLVLYACKRGEHEGTIKYDIVFDEQEKKERAIIDLLPNTMNYCFKQGSSMSEISFMGMFRTAYISNVQNQTNNVLFYFMPKGYFCSTQFGEKTIGFDPMPSIVLTHTKETKEILGLTAHKVHVSFSDSSQEEYDVWYTNDFAVENPNWHTPYKDIDGVLLDYRIKMKGISMHLTIASFSDLAIDTTKFSIPKSYTQVSPDEMDDIFDRHLNMF